MSKQKREASSSSGREGGEGEDDEKFKKDREMEIMSQHITPADYHFDDPGPSHMVYHSHQGASLTYEEPGRLQQLPPLHTRGPGRPRIHVCSLWGELCSSFLVKNENILSDSMLLQSVQDKLL